MHLLVRNKVEDFDRWLAVFEGNGEAAAAYGLQLEKLWREPDDPSQAFFIFRVDSRAQAEAFMSTPEATESGRVSGVIDGEYHFLESVEGY